MPASKKTRCHFTTKESIRINPKNFIPFFKMGFILNNNGSFYEAYPFAKKAIELNPNLWEGYHNLIKILRNLNRPIDAAKYAETAGIYFQIITYLMVY